MEQKQWIRHNEAIEILKFGRTKYFELIKYGQINSFRFAQKAFVEKTSIEKYQANHNAKYNKNRKAYLKEENKIEQK